ncbi:MAG: cyclodeaminase/cyclohydrolase family protein [Elusimicrobia bacterium]|nr:cyclodeaminase/cyclohydrolase family protein [Elusimicrobiota bacterium]
MTNRILDWRSAAKDLTEALSSTDPTPGGGAAAAVAGAMACALGCMAAAISLKSKKLNPEAKPELEAYAAKMASLRDRFHQLADEDAAAFERFMLVVTLPKEDANRARRLQETALSAAEVPLTTAEAAAEAYKETQRASRLAAGTVASDLWCACHLFHAAAESAKENVIINLRVLKDPARTSRLQERLTEALAAFHA